jgi:hypothetical protein
MARPIDRTSREAPAPDAFDCAALLDKLVALAAGGVSCELSLRAAAELAAEIRNEIVAAARP